MSHLQLHYSDSTHKFQEIEQYCYWYSNLLLGYLCPAWKPRQIVDHSLFIMSQVESQPLGTQEYPETQDLQNITEYSIPESFIEDAQPQDYSIDLSYFHEVCERTATETNGERSDEHLPDQYKVPMTQTQEAQDEIIPDSEDSDYTQKTATSRVANIVPSKEVKKIQSGNAQEDASKETKEKVSVGNTAKRASTSSPQAASETQKQFKRLRKASGLWGQAQIQVNKTNPIASFATYWLYDLLQLSGCKAAIDTQEILQWGPSEWDCVQTGILCICQGFGSVEGISNYNHIQIASWKLSPHLA